MGKTRGLLLAFEGIDAVGKMTQSSLLGSWLHSKGITSRILSFPDYSTPIGREIRGFLNGNRAYSPEVSHMLYALNRWEKKGEVESSLATCDVLIMNRYSASNLAYGTAIGLKLEWLANLERGLPVADFVIVLDAPPSFLSLRRGPDKDRYERNLGLQEKVRRAYLELAEEFKWAVVDATQGIQDTHLAVIARVSEVLERGGRSA